MNTFLALTFLAVVLAVPTVCYSSVPPETQCDCDCVTGPMQFVKKDHYDSQTGQWFCDVVHTTKTRCICDVGGKYRCNIRSKRDYIMENPNQDQGPCTEGPFGVSVTRIAEKECELLDRAFTIRMGSSPAFCVKPIIIDTDVVNAYEYGNAEINGLPFDEGLRDYWATLRFVYSTSMETLSVCGIYGEGKVGGRYYKDTRGDEFRWKSFSDSTILGSHQMSFELLDAEMPDKRGELPGSSGMGLTTHNQWLVWKTDAWCARASLNGTYVIEFDNMKNMVGAIVNTRESDQQQATPIIAAEHGLFGSNVYGGNPTSVFDRFRASLDEYPQRVRIDASPVCGCQEEFDWQY